MAANTVLDELVEWSQSLPLWQRDALRRIVVQGELADSDRAELLGVFLRAHGLEADDGPQAAVPLADEHLPSAPVGTPSVSLRSMSDIENVNALCGDAVSFAPRGMTVFYGENACGKSGFFRILRSCCRARARDLTVLPNVFADEPRGTPKASIDYQVGEEERSTIWVNGEAVCRDLAAVSVFDKDCASVYVNEENDLAFRPLGLDAFDKLCNFLQWLRGEVQRRISHIEAQRCSALDAPPVQEGSEVGRLIAGLGASTSPEQVKRLAGLSPDERQRLGHLTKALGDKPAERAAILRQSMRWMVGLRDHLRSLEQNLASSAVEKLKELQADAQSKRWTANFSATNQFSDEPLPGVGSETWRALWEAACRYAEAVVAEDPFSDEPSDEHRFPYAAEGEFCLLCQQPLTAEAAQRMERFERFVQADTEQTALEAEARFDKARTSLLVNSTLDSHMGDLIKEATRYSQDLGEAIAGFAATARRRREGVEQACNDAEWSQIPQLPVSPRKRVSELLQILDAEAEKLEAAAVDSTRRAMQDEHHQLRDRKWLSENLSDVLGEMNRLRTRQRLGQALAEADTTQVTNASNRLAKRIVSNDLYEAFSRELKRLRPHIDVRVSYARGSLGVTYHRIQLADAPDVPVGDIASEGEQTCIALAAFFAELSTSLDASAIVLDDPVSSLGAAYTDAVAERLIDEAKRRQVIVFTHSIGLLARVMEYTRRESCPLGRDDVVYHWVQRTGDRPGTVSCRDHPDLDRTFSDTARARQHIALAKQHAGSARQHSIRRGYAAVRSTCECVAVRQVLGSVVTPLRGQVTLKNLRNVQVCPEAVEELIDVHKLASEHPEGHWHTDEAQAPLPTVEDLERTIQRLENAIADAGNACTLQASLISNADE